MTAAGKAERGAYALIVDLPRPLVLAGSRFRGARLPAGRYAYCGSAYGPGGLAARLARHRRADNSRHWHVDFLTGGGRIVAVHTAPGGSECALMARILSMPGAHAPLAGFGSSDCRVCPAHLAAVPRDFTVRRLRAPVGRPAGAG